MDWFLKRLPVNSAWWEAKPESNRFSRFVWGILMILSVAFIAYKTAAEWHQLQNISWQLNPCYLLVSLGIYSVSIMLTASCWALIMGHISGSRAFWKHVITFCLTNLAQRLPTPIPYVSARTEAYAAQGISRKTTLTAMAVEITVTLLSAVVVALITLLAGSLLYTLYTKTVRVILYTLLVFLALPILFPQKFLGLANLLLARLHHSPLPVTLSRRLTLRWLGIFVVIWMNSGVLYYYLISGIFPIPKEILLLLVNISAVSGIAGWLGQALFFLPTPAIRQLTMIYLLNLYFPMPLAVAFALFARVCVMTFELIWAGLCLMVSILNKHVALFK